MIKSELDKKHDNACNVEIAGYFIDIQRELGSIFESLSKGSDTKMILLSVIDSYLGKELKGE